MPKGQLNSSSTLPPDALKQLVNRTSGAEVSALIGISKSYLSDMLSGKAECRKAYELAARYELSKRDKVAMGTHTVVALVPASSVEMLTTFFKGMGVDFVDITTMKSSRSD